MSSIPVTFILHFCDQVFLIIVVFILFELARAENVIKLPGAGFFQILAKLSLRKGFVSFKGNFGDHYLLFFIDGDIQDHAIGVARIFPLFYGNRSIKETFFIKVFFNDSGGGAQQVFIYYFPGFVLQ